MLNLVPFAGTGWQMTNGNRKSEFIGQLLEFDFPEPESIAIAAARIGDYQEALWLGIERFPQFSIPCADGADSAQTARFRGRSG